MTVLDASQKDYKVVADSQFLNGHDDNIVVGQFQRTTVECLIYTKTSLKRRNNKGLANGLPLMLLAQRV